MEIADRCAGCPVRAPRATQTQQIVSTLIKKAASRQEFARPCGLIDYQGSKGRKGRKGGKGKELTLTADDFRQLSCRHMGIVLPTDERRSEEHTSELQSQFHLVCRLLLEK